MFAVIGSHGTVYRINRGTSGNVEWIKPDGTVGGRLCAHPCMREQWIPTEDVMLAQMLALTTNERAWLAVANVHVEPSADAGVGAGPLGPVGGGGMTTKTKGKMAAACVLAALIALASTECQRLRANLDSYDQRYSDCMEYKEILAARRAAVLDR